MLATRRGKTESTMSTSTTLALTCGTVGTSTKESVAVGDTVTVSLSDENGMPIEVRGEVAEVLIEADEHQKA